MHHFCRPSSAVLLRCEVLWVCPLSQWLGAWVGLSLHHLSVMRLAKLRMPTDEKLARADQGSVHWTSRRSGSSGGLCVFSVLLTWAWPLLAAAEGTARRSRGPNRQRLWLNSQRATALLDRTCLVVICQSKVSGLNEIRRSKGTTYQYNTDLMGSSPSSKNSRIQDRARRRRLDEGCGEMPHHSKSGEGTWEGGAAEGE